MEDLLQLFDISISSVLSAIIFGIIGYWLYRRGKQYSRFDILAIGVALMIYPYFTRGPWGDWGVGFALCGLAYYFWKKW